MTAWTPEYRILINGTNATSLTLVGFTITSGRTNINSQAQAGYANLQIINKDNAAYDWTVNTSITVEVQDSSAAWVPIFGGRISDVTTAVRVAGAVDYVTQIQVVALGALSRLSKAVWTSSLAQADDGDQIYAILSDLLLNNWNEVPPAETWATYTPATQTWVDAEDIGLGEIDRPGQYEMEQRAADPIDFYSIVTQIASSALGYIYEDANGNVSYADAAHRQNYLVANGYTELDANQAVAAGLRQTIRSGAIVNKYQINYGNNFGSSKTAQDTTSQGLYGQYSVSENSYLHDATDAQSVVDRYVALRAYPRPQFESITFPLQNPEIDNADRDALLGIFMGQPVKVVNLPSNIYGGEFTGYIEGWTFTSTLNGLNLNFYASPTEFSAVAQTWAQVNAAESWNTISNTLQWEDAIGVIS
jgi:hypothetical protein